jgi:arsenate reductase-like glutaredoxin family protein
VSEQVDATKNKYGREEALKLAKSVHKIVAAKGKAITVIDLKADKPDDDTLAAVLLGPTGNLRAPTARVGKTLLVGFNPDAYQEVLG